MKIIANIKRNTGLSALSKSLRSVKRNKFIHNLVTARKVAIVGIANTNADFDDIIALQKFFIERNIHVEVLLYFPGKEIPQKMLLRKDINIFNKTELNWYGKPLIPFIQKFCNIEYDILIDLSLDELMPIRWISTLSRARFKVGSLSYSGNPYDLIITIEKSKGIFFLSEQIAHYLNLINNRFAQEQEVEAVTEVENQEETDKNNE
ncbi:MAG: hypothetical protein AB9846_11675 [Tenuifilaceae bacterium]